MRMSYRRASLTIDEWTRLLKAAYDLHPQFKSEGVVIDAITGIGGENDSTGVCVGRIKKAIDAQAKALAKALYLVVTDLPEVMAFRLAGELPSLETWARCPDDVVVATDAMSHIVYAMAEHISRDRNFGCGTFFLSFNVPLVGKGDNSPSMRITVETPYQHRGKHRVQLQTPYSLLAILAMPRVRQMLGVVEQGSIELQKACG